MTLPRPIVFGNWKMHGLRREALALAGALAERGRTLSGTLGIFPPFTVLAEVVRQVAHTPILVGGQDCHDRPEGPFTGCISAPMLADAGAKAVILGHSERRHGLGESNAWIRRKVEAAWASDLVVVLCIGETEAEWLAGRRFPVLEAQLGESLPQKVDTERLIIAYEPVWAIGSGRTPSLEEIHKTHLWLRQRLDDLGLGDRTVPLLYGGSVKADNAAAIMAQPEVDGVLVGGASLDPEQFWRIYLAGGGG